MSENIVITGTSGARIFVTPIHALQQQGLHKGVAGLCIGGGEATVIAIELVEQEVE